MCTVDVELLKRGHNNVAGFVPLEDHVRCALHCSTVYTEVIHLHSWKCHRNGRSWFEENMRVPWLDHCCSYSNKCLREGRTVRIVDEGAAITLMAKEGTTKIQTAACMLSFNLIWKKKQCKCQDVSLDGHIQFDYYSHQSRFNITANRSHCFLFRLDKNQTVR